MHLDTSIGFSLSETKAVLDFELRQTHDGYILTGGQLPAPLSYPDMEHAVRLVEFLSQKEGGELRIYGLDGKLTETQHRKAAPNMRTKDSPGSGLGRSPDLAN
jgi:hypothetical protein